MPDLAQGLIAAVAILTGLATPIVGFHTTWAIFFISLLFAIVHGVRRYGWMMFATYFVLAAVVSTFLENTSIMWGFPFGNYHYTGPGPRILHVPLVTGPFYVGLGYLCWQTANVLLGFADRRLSNGLDVVLLPALAAVLMTMFDLQVDPRFATIYHAWIWHDGGGYYGVPYTNFLGWWFTTYVFYQMFALVLRRARLPQVRSRGFWISPVLLYLNFAIPTMATFLFTDPGAETVTDPAGGIWKVADMNEGAFTVAVFTVLVMSVLALSQLMRSGEKAA